MMNLKNATTDMQAFVVKSTIHLPQAIVDAKQKALDNFLGHLKDLVSLSQSIQAVKNIFRSKTCLSQTINDLPL